MGKKKSTLPPPVKNMVLSSLKVNVSKLTHALQEQKPEKIEHAGKVFRRGVFGANSPREPTTELSNKFIEFSARAEGSGLSG